VFGRLAGGITMFQLGITRWFWVFGFLQAASILGFFALTRVVENVPPGRRRRKIAADICYNPFEADRFLIVKPLLSLATKSWLSICYNLSQKTDFGSKSRQP